MTISLIVPVYNRPDELDELLDTLTRQSRTDFEVVIVEDGSDADCRGVVGRYADRLDIAYHYQPNGGPSSARNAGARIARGDFFVFTDSDCLIPENYFETVYEHIERGVEFYGGPDKAGGDFSPLQKAVSYSMTSMFTTGGIRGKKRIVSKFMPRSFNLGISRELFERVGGFDAMRIGEDIDFSMRVLAAGAEARFLADAQVCHKRRTSMRLFFKQVFIFGTARVNLNIRYPKSRKPIFALPMVFTLGSLMLVLFAALGALWSLAALWGLLPLALLSLLWFADSSVRNMSVRIGWLSIWTSFIQLYGYGMGYMWGLCARRLRGKDEGYTYRVTRFFSSKTR